MAPQPPLSGLTLVAASFLRDESPVAAVPEGPNGAFLERWQLISAETLVPPRLSWRKNLPLRSAPCFEARAGPLARVKTRGFMLFVVFFLFACNF